MKIKTFFAIACSALALVVSGCVSTPDGHTTGGIPLTKDKRVARYPRPVDQVVAATVVVLNRNGKILVDNTVDNTFKAKVNERTVWVKVSKVDDKLTELLIQARHGAVGDIDLASELDKQIALQLTVSP